MREGGFEAFVVGGCVRDSLISRPVADWDITTNAKPDEVRSLFPRTIDTGIRHGTITVRHRGSSYEVTTYRSDGEYLDGRHPKEVFFENSLDKDLARRDFTMNAMAYNEEEGLIDLYGGLEDIKQRRIRAVGCALDRFREDALRMLRAYRFASQLKFTPDEEIIEAVRKEKDGLRRVSAERIQVELTKLLMGENPGILRSAAEAGLTKVFLPELDEMLQTPQSSRYHAYNVGEHTLRVVENCEKKWPLRLAALLHDCGKPSTRRRDALGQDHFTLHCEMGVGIAEKRMKALRYDNATIRRVKNLVRWHDFEDFTNLPRIRELYGLLGKEEAGDLIALMIADTKAKSDLAMESRLPEIELLREAFQSIEKNQEACRIADLRINGEDLMELGYTEGKAIGNTLKALLAEVMEDPKKNERGFLQREALSMLQNPED